MKTITDTIAIRVKRIAAYNAGKYRLSPPPVYSGGWCSEAWHNWVKFDDENLNGFIPYNAERHNQARNTAPEFASTK